MGLHGVRQLTVLTGFIALSIAACGLTPPSVSSSATLAESCLVLADEEIVSLAWSQDVTHVGLGLRTADGRPAARTVDVRSMRAGELVEDDRMIPGSVVVTSDGQLVWLRARREQDVDRRGDSLRASEHRPVGCHRGDPVDRHRICRDSADGRRHGAHRGARSRPARRADPPVRNTKAGDGIVGHAGSGVEGAHGGR